VFDDTSRSSPSHVSVNQEETWHYLKKKRQKLWLWTALGPETGQLLDWEGGCHDQATRKKMVDRLDELISLLD